MAGFKLPKKKKDPAPDAAPADPAAKAGIKISKKKKEEPPKAEHVISKVEDKKPKAGELPAPKAKPDLTPKEVEKKPAAAAPAPKAAAAAPAPSAPKKKPAPKKKVKKSTSNVFSAFEKQQIQEFKEAFQMIDQDRNGIIDQGDLRATYAAIGIRMNDQDMLNDMVAEAGAPINFTIFLGMLADKLHGTDPEDIILKSCKVLDPDNKGVIHIDELKKNLMGSADRFDAEEWKQVETLLQMDADGNVDYKALCYTLTHGGQDDDE